MRLPRRLIVALLLALAPGIAVADGLLVFAAASLKGSLDEIAADWTAETGQGVTLSFAGSSALARQIGAGAPADVVVSANAAWMDALETDGLLVPGTRKNLLGNALVLIAPKDETGDEVAPFALAPGIDLAGRLGEGRLAMALVDAVPAGIYGRAALDALGLWESVRGRVAQADNVRAALALVAAGEAALGVVYATDAMAEDDVVVLDAFPASTHPPIVYPAAAVAGGNEAAARAFLDALARPAARMVFEAHGFTVPGVR